MALIGGGGAGKSTLTYSFAKYLEKRGLSCACVNLDPGCKHIKYDAAVDIRSHYSLAKIMAKEKLGPNGALKLVYAEASRNPAFVKELNALKADFVLLDTAGSLELFLFGGAPLLSEFCDAVCFLVEQGNAASEKDLTVLKALNALQRLEYALPTLTVVNKADQPKPKQKKSVLGGFRAANGHLNALLAELGGREKLCFVSAMDRRGFGELFDALNETKCSCGDYS
ncbi:MAG: ATP/GTP-binding protein [Candidatus Micrarchaeia archaeon]